MEQQQFNTEQVLFIARNRSAPIGLSSAFRALGRRFESPAPIEFSSNGKYYNTKAIRIAKTLLDTFTESQTPFRTNPVL